MSLYVKAKATLGNRTKRWVEIGIGATKISSGLAWFDEDKVNEIG